MASVSLIIVVAALFVGIGAKGSLASGITIILGLAAIVALAIGV